MQNEWRRFELERADWDVERIKLKAQLIETEKRVAQLTSLYNISLKHISVLEGLLRDAKQSANKQTDNHAVSLTKSGKSATPLNSADTSSTSSAAAAAAAAGGTSVEEIVAMTRTRREKSRDLLTQCLSQIDVLLGTSTRESGTGLTPPFPISDVLDPKTPSP
ncbi:hypothetical protein FBU59_006819, partial [Linderina macrospora]